MGTNFYVKGEKRNVKLCPHCNKELSSETASKHIGKRSGAGMYCYLPGRKTPSFREGI